MTELQGLRLVTASGVLAVSTLTPMAVEAQGRFPQQLTVFDRAANVVSALGVPTDYTPAAPIFSPDGTRLAVVDRRASIPHIRVFNLSTGAASQITFPSGLKWMMAWSPDGSQIAFVARRGDYDEIYRRASDGTGSEELLYRHRLGVNIQGSLDWSPDGRFLCFESGSVLWVLPVNGDRKAIEVVREEYRVGGGRFSPDSRFLAYTSDESGRNEIYVRVFDASSGTLSADGRKWQVSNQGGSGVFWSPGGAELYYVAAEDAAAMAGVMAVEITPAPFKAGLPELLFRAPIVSAGAISRGGQRFAFLVSMPPADRLPLPERTVVTVVPGTLARYVGTYSSGPFDEDEDVVVTVDGNQLMIQVGISGRMRPLSAESDTRFFMRDPTGDTNFEFVMNDKGVVTHLNRIGGTKWTRK